MASTAANSSKSNGGGGGGGAPPKKKLKVDTGGDAADDNKNNGHDDGRDDESALLDSTLFRLTQGLPRRELNLIVSESNDCEALLLRDIEILEKALEEERECEDGGGDDGEKPKDVAFQARKAAVVDSFLTPLDRYWTASALLGRLRGPLAVPPIPTLQQRGGAPAAAAAAAASTPAATATAATSGTLTSQQAPSSSANKSSSLSPTPPAGGANKLADADAASLWLSKELVDLTKNPRYSMRHETPNSLLALHKKIVSHKTSLVFKRPVKPEEAPGYTDRIKFPMDLSSIRKMIVSRHVVSYEQMHRYLGLISHNCVCFNGRETDYGLVAKEFEAAADELVRAAVLGVDRRRTPTPRPPSVTFPAAAAAAAAAASSSSAVAATTAGAGGSGGGAAASASGK